MKEIRIETFNDCDHIPYGKTYYFVEEINRQYFKTKCPVCDGTKELEAKGADGKLYSVGCPFCTSSAFLSNRNQTLVRDYKVRRGVINQIIIRGDKTYTAFDNRKSKPFATAVMFYKKSEIPSGAYEKYVPDESKINPECSEDDLIKGATEYLFAEKKEAEKLCQALIEKEKNALKEFNRVNGAEFKWPF